MNKTPGSDFLPYSIILVVFAVTMISILSAEDPDIEELNSQEFQRAVEDKAFVLRERFVLASTTAGSFRRLDTV